MVRQMREYPWERSALGDPRDWPSSLRTACRICLTSRFPMIVWWGPELRFLYNDACRPLLGDKHPALGLPGRQIWSEIWDTIGPMLESVLSTGQATWSQDLLLPLRRREYLEETYWTYSCSPLHDEGGTVRGLFTAVSETTEQVVGRRRLAVLQELGAQQTRAHGVTEVGEAVVRSLARAGQVVPYAAIYLRDQHPDGEASAGAARTIASSAPDLSPQWPADEVLRTGQPAVLRDLGKRFGPLPSGDWPEPPTEAMVLPLHGAGGSALIGVIVLAVSAGRALDGDYQDFLALVAQQTAAMINGTIAYQTQLGRTGELAELGQRETALALQHAILGPVKLPGGFSARYEPATRPLEVGGDWHDILRLPDGRIAIVVGDCVGHDLSAATAMGQLRSACRAVLLQNTSPGRALAAMDRFAASVPGTEYTTVFCAVLDPETGQLTYSSAGHPPAIVTRADGGVVLLEDARSFPLAARPGTDRLEAHQLLPPRSTLLLYTDGLVERRGRPLTDGIAKAGAAVVSGGEGGLEDLATQLMADLAPGDGYADDVAIVLYRHPAPLELAFPASLGEISPARTRLRRWLARCDLSIRTAQDTLIAAGEAVANAIEHGHRDHPGQGIRLRAAATASHLQLSIADTGRWLPPRPELAQYRGRGLELMRTVMDHVSIDAGAAGTTVTMDVRIASGNSA